MRAHYEAELWIGAPMWPLGVEAPLPAAGPMCVEFQVAGVFCHHQRFYGLKFVVPNDDRLAVLVDSYLSSNLPGSWTAEYATPLEDLLQLRDRLQALGLALDPVEYAKSRKPTYRLRARLPGSMQSSPTSPSRRGPTGRMLKLARRVGSLDLARSGQAARSISLRTGGLLRRDTIRLSRRCSRIGGLQCFTIQTLTRAASCSNPKDRSLGIPNQATVL
jgi:hypothetical protein